MSSGVSGWGARQELSDFDALVWRSDHHPELSNCVSLIGLLDGTPDWSTLRQLTVAATELVPRLRERIAEPPVPVVTPVWVTDQAFNLDYHLQRTRLPEPGGRAELLEFARKFALVPFDNGRPLWEACLVEGFEGDRSALVLKLHHAITDGSGFVQLLEVLQTLKMPRPGTDPTVHAVSTDRVGPALTPRRLVGVAERVTRDVASTLGGLVRHSPLGHLRNALGMTWSLARSLPPAAPPSPLWRDRTSRDWRFGVMECELGELKAAAKSVGGTVNDAFLAALLDGIGRYHEHHGESMTALPVMVPVNRRPDNADPGGNYMTAGFISGPTATMAAGERIALIGRAVRAARDETALGALGIIAPVLSRMPSALGTLALQQMGGRADLGASNVRGLAAGGFVAGVPMTHLFGFGTLTGTAVLVTMISHGSKCCIGVNCDATAVTDSDVLMKFLQEGLDAVLALATES